MNRRDAIRVLFLGTLLSALFCWGFFLTEGGTYGGQAVSMTATGHAVFLAIGAFLGLYSGTVIGGIYSEFMRRYGRSARHLSGSEVVFLGVLISIATGCLFIFAMMLLITIPDDLFRIIFDVHQGE